MTAPPPARPARRALGDRRGRRGPADEDAYRRHRYHGAEYFTSRQEHENLTVVVKRFPEHGERLGADAPVFLLVHGLGVSSRYFQPVAAELSRTGRVFVVDLPGYGAAPNPRQDVSLGDHAEVLAGVVTEVGRRWPGAGAPVIVGHSMGANVVAELALRHPGVADRIVLMAPTIEPPRRALSAAAGRLIRDATREPPRVVMLAATEYLLRCGLPYLLRQTPHPLSHRLEERMPQLAARVLAICGDRDPIVGEEWGRRLAELAPDAEYRTVRGPHVVMHTDPATIADHIARWLG